MVRAACPDAVLTRADEPFADDRTAVGLDLLDPIRRIGFADPVHGRDQLVDEGIVFLRQMPLPAFSDHHHLRTRGIARETSLEQFLPDHAGVAGWEEADVVVFANLVPRGATVRSRARKAAQPNTTIQPRRMTRFAIDSNIERFHIRKAETDGEFSDAAGQSALGAPCRRSLLTSNDGT